MGDVVSEKSSWSFPRGHEIAPGRTTLRLLGGGNRCEVYLIRDARSGRRLVAKVLRPGLADDEGALRALRREAEALRELAHPVLPRGVGERFDGPYPQVVVEHLEGPTLRKLIGRDDVLPAAPAVSLALELASALGYMAAEGWLHLDVKPGNIVMSDRPRLIDLSLARRVERASRLSGCIGTNAYMAPEQCHPRGDVGPAADVWGLGATLYHAVSGMRPFREPRTRAEDGTLEDRFPQLEDEPQPLPWFVPGALADAIVACLEKDPSRRPTAKELAGNLRGVDVVDEA